MSTETEHIAGLINEIIALKRLGDPTNWTRSTFESLSEDILMDTGERVSYRTLSRIINAVQSGSSYAPNSSTLDILSRYAGYENWFSYSKESKTISTPNKRSSFRNIALIIGLMVIIGSWIITNQNRSDQESPEIRITSNKYLEQVPGTITFNYEYLKKANDTAYLNIVGDQNIYAFSKERPARLLINKDKRLINQNVKDPGLYHWSTSYQGKSMTEGRFFGLNKQWEYFIYNPDELTFGYQKIQVTDGAAYSTPTQGKAYDLVSKKGWFTRFVYMDTIALNLDESTIETRLKNIYKPEPACNISKVSIYGENDDIEITLSDESCFSNNKVVVAEQSISGRREDVSKFKRKYDDWVTLKIVTSDRIASIYIDEELVKQVAYQNPLGSLHGFNFWFIGAGEIDYVRGYDGNGLVIYSEEFEVTNTLP